MLFSPSSSSSAWQTNSKTRFFWANTSRSGETKLPSIAPCCNCYIGNDHYCPRRPGKEKRQIFIIDKHASECVSALGLNDIVFVSNSTVCPDCENSNVTHKNAYLLSFFTLPRRVQTSETTKSRTFSWQEVRSLNCRFRCRRSKQVSVAKLRDF